jgi:hypothetical protein
VNWQRGRISEVAPLLQSLANGGQHNYLQCALAWIAAEGGDEAGARAVFEEQAAGDFARVQDDQGEPLSLSLLTVACVFLGDRERARRLYDRLSPFAGRCVYQGVAMNYFGTSSFYLGQLAAMLDRWDEADAHFAAARRIDERLESRPWLARTLHAWASALFERGSPPQRMRARALDEEARALAQGLGMQDLERRVAAALHADREAGSPPRRPARPAAEKAARSPFRTHARSVFRREGDFWTVAMDALVVRVHHTKGMDDLAYLLTHPQRDVHVLDLFRPLGEEMKCSPWAETSVRGSRGGSREGEIDVGARGAYRSRLAELRDDLLDAERCNDGVRALRARAEIEEVAAALGAAYGLGRRRCAADPLEKARKAVAWRVRHAIRRIEHLHPELGRHLRQSVRTGTCCRYAPAAPVPWEVGPP